MKNVLASRGALILHDGVLHAVADPVLVPLAIAEDYFPVRDRRAHRLFGVTECLMVRREESAVLRRRPALAAV